MYNVTIEYKLNGHMYIETIENLVADSKQEASDQAITKVHRDYPTASYLDVLSIEQSGKVA